MMLFHGSPALPVELVKAESQSNSKIRNCLVCMDLEATFVFKKRRGHKICDCFYRQITYGRKCTE